MRDSYIAAGGRVEDADLFSTAADERWIDTHILDDLAETKLAAHAEALREREGLGEVRIVTGARIPYQAVDVVAFSAAGLNVRQQRRR